MSRIVRKPAFCICENKDADQLRGNREADQRLCFHFIDSTIPLLPKSEISSLYPSSMAVQPGLCGTRSKPRRPVFSQRGSYMAVPYKFAILHYGKEIVMLADCTLDLQKLPIHSIASRGTRFFFPVLLSGSSFHMHIGRWIR